MRRACQAAGCLCRVGLPLEKGRLGVRIRCCVLVALTMLLVVRSGRAGRCGG